MITLRAERDSVDTSDLVSVLQAARDGDLGIRATPSGNPAEARIAQALNDLLESWERQLRPAPPQSPGSPAAAGPAPVSRMARFAGILTRGRTAEPLPLEIDGKPLRGAALRLAKDLNRLLNQLQPFASEVSRLAREMGTEGKLGGQIRIEGAAGLWKRAAKDVNRLAGQLTDQLRAIAHVATSAAKGDFSQRVTVRARGELLQLRDAVNSLVDQQSGFAGEVTRLAREMGAEGKLGGQAHVRGATGVWKDLTRSVNLLVSTMAAQVRAIAEVATAVAEGDLTRSIAVEARGEMGAVRDAINKMIRNLRETTRKNAEQDWLKTNVAAFTRTLQGQRDIETVSRQILSELVPLVNAQQGAFYLAEERPGQDTVLHFLAGYACDPGSDMPAQIRPGEGLVGECARQRRTILVSSVPDAYLRIRSGLGEARARSVVVLPVLFEDHLKAVIELASFSEFQPVHRTLLEEVTGSIGIVCNTIAATMRTEALLAQSQALTQELQKTNAELEEKAEQLALTSRYKSEFMANMSHELRTPLNSLLILARLLSENTEKNLTPKQVEYAGAILASGTDLLSLINDILDLSKIESGTMNIEVRSVRLKEVCDDLQPLFRPIAQSKKLAFSIDIEPSLPPTIITDSKRIQQILRNLLSNAFKFTAHGSVSLRIGTASTGWRKDHPYLGRSTPAIYFAVDDTGIGIPADKQTVIFEPFQQADMTTSRKYGGTGLGLSISRELAKLLAGEIRLVSTVGKGSTFTLFVPQTHPTSSFAGAGDELAEPAAAPPREPPVFRPEERPASLPVASLSEGSGLLLFVELEGTPETPVLEAAQQYGFDGIVAADASSALELARRVKPGAIAIGMGTAASEAWVLLDCLKHDPELLHIPVWLFCPRERFARGRSAGALGCTESPVRKEDLGLALARLRGCASASLRSVLVTGDAPGGKEGLEELLRGDSLEIVRAAGGAEALEALQGRPFDAVILSPPLPDPGSAEFFRDLVRLKPEPERPPVLLYPAGPGQATPFRLAAGDAVVLRCARTPEQLVEESTIRLHRPVSSLSTAQKHFFERSRLQDPVLADRRVLIADDDMRNIYALTTVLERHRMKVSYALNGKEALAALRGSPTVELVLMDIMMPEMDGIEAMREIRRMDPVRALPIIALTAKAMREDRERCIKAGANDYTPKPVDVERLLSLIRVWLYQPGAP